MVNRPFALACIKSCQVEGLTQENWKKYIDKEEMLEAAERALFVQQHLKQIMNIKNKANLHFKLFPVIYEENQYNWNMVVDIEQNQEEKGNEDMEEM